MLISDAYSWGNGSGSSEIVLIPYYGYICSDDSPNDYVFNPHPYSVVVIMDAYIAGIEYFSQIIITCEYIDGTVYNHSDYNSLGVV